MFKVCLFFCTPRERGCAQNSKVLQFDIPLRLNEWKPAVCNLAVGVLKSRNGFRNVALAAQEERLFVQSHCPQFLKYSLSCLNPISTIQIIHNCPVILNWPSNGMFSSQSPHHVGKQHCVMLSHIMAGWLRFRWLRGLALPYNLNSLLSCTSWCRCRLHKWDSQRLRYSPAATRPHTCNNSAFTLWCFVSVWSRERLNGSAKKIGSLKVHVKVTLQKHPVLATLNCLFGPKTISF